jgi:protein required for attachment to host cells
MNEIRMPHNTLVIVADGRKVLFLRNHGDERFADLRIDQVFVDANPPTREQGTDKPGRAFGRDGGRRSAIEPTDWHNIEAHRFAREVAGVLERLVREQRIKALVIAAPPRTLSDLREALHTDIKQRVIAEFDKDLTHHPVNEIEQHLVGYSIVPPD